MEDVGLLAACQVGMPNMCTVEDLIATPSLETLDEMSREQLLQVAEHFSVVVVDDKRLKDGIKHAVKEE